MIATLQRPFDFIFWALEQRKGRLADGQPDCRADHSKGRFAAGEKGPAIGGHRREIRFIKPVQGGQGSFDLSKDKATSTRA
jgi:hypothetical protein